MPAPTLISYETFLANAQETDIRALALLAAGDTIKTMNATEAGTYQAIGQRLYDAGCLTRFRRSLEVLNGETWHVFDGRVNPPALVYVAQCAMERVTLSREVIPAPAPTP